MNKPRVLFAVLALLILLVLLGCSRPPATQVYIVVSPTHQPPTLTAMSGMEPTTIEPEATEPPPTSAEPTTDTAGNPIVVESSPAFPTPLVNQIQVAEQVFQNGRMFWVQPTREVWVMIAADDTGTHGEWLIFEDSFVEGEDEIDPELTPPADTIQPRRGFGKLWRQNENLRTGLGWGITEEFGFVTDYEYRSGGYLDSDGNYMPGPGVHVLVSAGNEIFAFDEDGQTWRLLE